MKVTIGKKLFGGFLFILLLLIIESIVFNRSISFTESSYKQLINKNLDNAMLAQHLENTYLIEASAVRNFLLTNDETYISQYNKHIQDAHKTIHQMLLTYPTNKDQEIIHQLSAFQVRFEEIVNKEITFKKEGNKVAYTHLLNTSGKTISNVFQAKIDTLVKGQEQLVQQGTTNLERSIENTKKISIYLGIFSILIGTILAIRISRSISQPLYILAKYTEKIITPKGKINPDFPTVNSNIYEVKQLYESIRLAFLDIKHHINQLDSEIETDALTGVANRRTFDLVIREQIENRSPFSLIFIDIDFFKKVNDTSGHLVGDAVLRFLAQMMHDLLRDGDLCFRYGGEEFAIIVPHGDRETSTVIAERFRKKLEVTISPSGKTITISLGIAIYPEHGQTANDLIAAADEALYQSKTSGRNKTTFYIKE